MRLTAAQNNTRIEAKFVAPAIYVQHLLAWLQAHPLLFKLEHADRWVNNIYFDSYELATYTENLSGVSQRTKIRYRWYGQSLALSSGIFEVKHKDNLRGWKQQCIVPLAPYETGNSWHEVTENLLLQLDDEVKAWLLQYSQPVLLNQYYRRYFISADRKIRATLDTSLRVFDQRYTDRPNLSRHSLLLPAQTVLEFKFNPKYYANLGYVLDGLCLRYSRCSKYVNGVRSIFGY